jgi:hypothetical protein
MYKTNPYTFTWVFMMGKKNHADFARFFPMGDEIHTLLHVLAKNHARANNIQKLHGFFRPT